MAGNEDSNTGDVAGPWDVSRRRFLKGAALGTGVVAADLSLPGGFAGAATNTISTENAILGNDPADWDIDTFDESIEGFAAEYSVNAGETVAFKINTDSKNYRIRIFRLGWYNGLGARLITTIQRTLTTAQVQPAPITDPLTGIIDCGNWAVSATWAVPANAVSGVYIANLERLDAQGGENRLMFLVRNDGRAASIMLQTSDTTYQAYNYWGGNSLYTGTATYGRATKVSYNRPLRGSEVENSFFYGEYPLVRWLERNGYDVTYCGDIDTHRSGSQLLNKKVFISSGHDEYWSGAQRANVEAAIAAGVNVAFLTGNECFWRIRFENSVDGQNQPNKTIVCYKESLENAKVDPSPEWTGLWQDPRFATPTNGGGRPQNALTGTLFRAINPTDQDFSIEVPYAYRLHRLWRNTSVTSLAPGQKATLAQWTLGNEWNTDADNGFRPAGLIRLSETTQTAQIMQDNGATYLDQPLTHWLTMYKAPSGARVFSSGTVQWCWGLDDYHLGQPEPAIPADVRMQQATLNFLADMGAQPATKQSNLVAASASSDTLPPVSTITAPAANATVPVGSTTIIQGTAVDSGGGLVAGVEVSTDNGATWHPATGTSSWSYSFVPSALGPITIKVRAVDDSCNLEVNGPTRTLIGGPRAVPCSIWPAGTLPAVIDTGDAGALEVGVRFRAQSSGFIKAIRFYKSAANTGTHVGHLWSNTGALLGTATFTNETATGWQQASLTTPVAVSAGVTYVASYYAPAGHYSADAGYFANSFVLAPLTALANGIDGPNGVYRYGSSGFPTQTYGSANYWVDVVFDTDDQLAPTVVERSPGANVQAVAPNSTVSAVFSEAMNPASIVIQLRNAANALVPGAVSYVAAERRAVFTPSAALAVGSVYTATVTAAQDVSGQSMVGTPSWSFTTASAPGSLPATLWTSADLPATLAVADPNAVELGVRFTSDVDALVTGIRFYKDAANNGTHTGHLWTASGQMLASVAFTGESGSGWQQANLSSPVAINKNTTYVVSYHTTSGFYSNSASFFGSAHHRAPLHALASTSGNENGVYLYTAVGGFPTNSWYAGNYWVDVVVAAAPDSLAPTVVDFAPARNLEAVATTSSVLAVFSEPINPASLSFSLKGPGNVTVPASVAYNAGSLTATLTPSAPLAALTTYNAQVTANDVAGNPLSAPFTWSFTTAPAPGGYPLTLWPSSAVPATAAAADPNSVEIGMKFRSDINGQITGIRFYKGPGNTGSHVGHLWTATGTLLGSAVFTAESGSGWQQAKFGSPIPIVAGVTYVASYLAPNGRYSHTGGGLQGGGVNTPPLRAIADGVEGGNGVYAYGAGGFPTNTWGGANYWVDVLFVAP